MLDDMSRVCPWVRACGSERTHAGEHWAWAVPQVGVRGVRVSRRQAVCTAMSAVASAGTSCMGTRSGMLRMASWSPCGLIRIAPSAHGRAVMGTRTYRRPASSVSMPGKPITRWPLDLSASGKYRGDDVGNLRLRIDDGLGLSLGPEGHASGHPEQIRNALDDLADGLAGVHSPVLLRGSDITPDMAKPQLGRGISRSVFDWQLEVYPGQRRLTTSM